MFKKRNSLVGSKDDREPIKQVDESNNLSFLNMPSVSNWNLRPVLYLSVFLLFGVVIWSQGHAASKMVLSSFGQHNLREVDFLEEDLPKEVIDYVRNHAKDIRINERYAQIMDVKMFYREANPGSILPHATGKTFLLLHGQAFTSQTWEQSLPTIQTLAVLGNRVLAIDLPGFGNSPKGSKANPEEFLSEVISTLSPGQSPIVVSPSMSGAFSLPLLINRPDLMCGLVAVAPVMSDKFSASQYASVSTPTLIVVGQKDTSLGRISVNHLSQIPSASKAQVFPNGRHPCYLDDPKRWHRLLYNFEKRLEC